MNSLKYRAAGSPVVKCLGRVVRWAFLLPLVATTAFLSVLGAGAAYAYLSGAGSGTGSAKTSNLNTVTLQAVTGTPSTPLVPGGTGDALLRVSNPNSFAVSLTAVSFNPAGSITFDAAHAACATTDSKPVVRFNVPPSELPQAIAPSSAVTLDLTNAVTMDGTATGSCQGATINIPVTITVQGS